MKEIRLKSFMLFCALLVSVAGWADAVKIADDVIINNLQYDLYEDGDTKYAEIVGCESSFAGNIPENVTYYEKIYTVTTIGPLAFRNPSFTNLSIPSTITTISPEAFRNCDITAITISEDNPVFDSRDNCNAIIRKADNTLYRGFNSSTIPSTVTTIGKSAFANCDFTSITIPGTIKTIEQWAFEHCGSLQEVTLSEGIETIGRQAFVECSSLKNVAIPSSITSYGDEPFYHCNKIEQIKVAEGNTIFDSRGNCNAIIRTADNVLLLGCKNTVIPSSVEKIGSYAFEDCEFEKYSVTNGVKELELRAFASCPNLTEIKLPSTITKLGGGLFAQCSNLKTVYCFAATPPTFLANVFYQCDALEKIYVPAGSVDSYKNTTGWNEHAGKIVEIPSTEVNLANGVVEINGNTYKQNNEEKTFDGIIVLTGTIEVEGQPIVISGGTESSPLEVVLKNVSSTGKGSENIQNHDDRHDGLRVKRGSYVNISFEGTNTLNGGKDAAGLRVEEKISSDDQTIEAATVVLNGIGYNATLTCEAKEGGGGGGAGIGASESDGYGNIIINSGTIVAKGYNGGAGIGSGWKWGNEIPSYGTITMNGGTITAEGSTGSYNGNSCPYGIGTSTGSATLDINGGSYNGTIKVGTKNSAVKEYKELTFEGLESGKEITVKEYGLNEKTLTVDGDGKISVIALEDISNDVLFCGKKLLQVYCNEFGDVTKGGAYSTEEALTLTATPQEQYKVASVKVQGTTEAITANEDGTYTITADDHKKIDVTFALDWFVDNDIKYSITSDEEDNKTVKVVGNNYSVETITIPASVTVNDVTYNVTAIGDHAFNGCSSLASITIPAGVTTIESWAFEGCSALQTITLPSTLTSLGGGAFFNSGLTEIVIPEGITEIGTQMFNQCASLKKVTFPSTVTSINGDALYNCTSLEAIYFKSETPLTDPFEGFTKANVTIYCPIGSRNDYKEYWTEYKSIRPYDYDDDKEGIVITIGSADSNGIVAYSFNNEEAVSIENETTVEVDVKKGSSLALTNTGKSASNYSYAAKVTDQDGVEQENSLSNLQADMQLTISFYLDKLYIDGLAYSIESGSEVRVLGFAEGTSGTTVAIPETIDFSEDGVEKVTYTVKGVAKDAFVGCSNITNINVASATPPAFGENAFSGIADKSAVALVVPLESVDAYKAAEGWKDFAVQPMSFTITIIPPSCGRIEVYDAEGNQLTATDNKISVYVGTTVTIKAIPNDGYGFSWMKIDDVSYNNDTFNQWTIDGDINVTAAFYYIIPSIIMYEDVAYERKDATNEVELLKVSDEFSLNNPQLALFIPESIIHKGDKDYQLKVVSIKEKAFSNNTSLQSVTMTTSVKSIGSYAFEGCSNLKKLEITRPQSIVNASIRTAALRADETITLPEIGDHAFDDIIDIATLYVPEEWKEVVKATPVWQEFNKVKEVTTEGVVLAELTLTSSDGGTLTASGVTADNESKLMKLTEGTDVIIEVAASEGYVLTSLTYNGDDVIGQLVDGKLTISGINGENNVAAVFTVGTGVASLRNDVRCVYAKDGTIIVNGSANGEVIMVFDTSGRILHRAISNGESVRIPMAKGQTYIVRVGKQSIKLTHI